MGDLTTADYVSYMVPGMFFTIDGQVGDWADTATDLYREQVAWLKHFASTDPSLEGKTVATVAWIGYETPHLLTVGSLDLAYQGAEYLTQDIEALQSLRGGTEPFVVGDRTLLRLDRGHARAAAPHLPDRCVRRRRLAWQCRAVGVRPRRPGWQHVRRARRPGTRW